MLAYYPFGEHWLTGDGGVITYSVAQYKTENT